jgi:quercetin 2,3-dioxygenase
MSTGTGVFHSEYNNGPDKPVEFLQIWIFPNRLNVEPRYGQATLDIGYNHLQQILSPEPGGKGKAEPREGGVKAGEQGVWIYQDAWFHLGRWDAGKDFEYRLKKKGNGIYLFVIKGAFQAEGQRLDERDALGITDVEMIGLRSLEAHAEILVIEVPMNNKI